MTPHYFYQNCVGPKDIIKEYTRILRLERAPLKEKPTKI